MKEYKSEIEDILVSNRQLAVELQFDLRQHDKQELDKQESKKAREAAAAATAPRESGIASAEKGGGGERVPLTPLSIPRLNSASKAGAGGSKVLRSCAAGIEPRALNLAAGDALPAAEDRTGAPAPERGGRVRAGRSAGQERKGDKGRGKGADEAVPAAKRGRAAAAEEDAAPAKKSSRAAAAEEEEEEKAPAEKAPKRRRAGRA